MEKTRVLAKILRNTLDESIDDTFNLILGHQGYTELYNHGKKIKKVSYGIADLFIIPLISKAIMNYGFPIKYSPDSNAWIQDKERQTAFRWAIGFFGLFLQVPRLLIAASLGTLVLPIILFVHAIKYPFVKYYENQFYRLEGELTENITITKDNPNSTTAMLKTYVELTDATLNELKASSVVDKTAIITSQSPKNLTYIYTTENITKAKDNPNSTTTMLKTYVELTAIEYLRSTLTPKLFFKISPTNNSQQNAAIEAGRRLGCINFFSQPHLKPEIEAFTSKPTLLT